MLYRADGNISVIQNLVTKQKCSTFCMLMNFVFLLMPISNHYADTFYIYYMVSTKLIVAIDS